MAVLINICMHVQQPAWTLFCLWTSPCICTSKISKTGFESSVESQASGDSLVVILLVVP